ncbi:MAG: polymer-forming cytoskeletal protein [Vicinamibacterales bacterium]
MSTFGKSISLIGELRAQEDLIVEGHIEGPVLCENFAVTLAVSAEVKGDVIARDITVFGRSAGQLVASDVVDIRPAACVTGAVLARRFILNDGAQFTGRADPAQMEAALSVARFNLKKRDQA